MLPNWQFLKHLWLNASLYINLNPIKIPGAIQGNQENAQDYDTYNTKTVRLTFV